MISILDYGMGNIKSVCHAFMHIGADIQIIRTGKEVMQADALVVPGVGAFGDCINNLKKANALHAVKDAVSRGIPYLGICLGMHILLEESEEAPGVKGLGIFRGSVRRFPQKHGFKVPHMGWNTVRQSAFCGIPDNPYMYFVHSYYADPEDKSAAAGATEYGLMFCSMILRKNICAVQFHPEKSQQAGLSFLMAFTGLCR